MGGVGCAAITFADALVLGVVAVLGGEGQRGGVGGAAALGGGLDG